MKTLGEGKAIVLWLVLLVVGESSQATAINVFVDRDPIELNEAFRLTFEVRGAVKANPDFAPLEKDFKILGRSQRSDITLINGKFMRSTTWILNLMAKRPGSLTIPSLYFGNNASRSLTITVQEVSAWPLGTRQDLFLEVEVQPKDPYVQTQVIYTVRLFRQPGLELYDASFSEPTLIGGEAVIEPLGKDRFYQRWRDGKRFTVIERTYGLYPQQSGTLMIEPIVFTAQIIDGIQSLLDPFGQSISTRQVQSESVTLVVRPIPHAFKSKQWLPAKRLELKEVWSDDPSVLEVGQPVTRTVALLAYGLTAGQLPELITRLPPSLKSYPDPPVLGDHKKRTGVIGIRQEKLTLMASQAGDYTLPEIELFWWNTDKDQVEIARLPARAIHVAGVVDNQPTGSARASALRVEPQPAMLPPAGSARSSQNHLLGKWMNLLLALGWGMSSAAAWWYRQRLCPPALQQIPYKQFMDHKALIKVIRQACHENNPVKAKDALLKWGKECWPVCPPRSLVELGRRCDERLGREIEQLNRTLYRRLPKSWNGMGLWQAFEEYHSTPKARVKTSVLELEPLYKT